MSVVVHGVPQARCVAFARLLILLNHAFNQNTLMFQGINTLLDGLVPRIMARPLSRERLLQCTLVRFPFLPLPHKEVLVRLMVRFAGMLLPYKKKLKGTLLRRQTL